MGGLCPRTRIWRARAGHLHDAQLDDELRAELTDVRSIQARLTHGHAYDLIADYGYAADPLSRQILRSLRLSARSLSADPGLLQAQLGSLCPGAIRIPASRLGPSA